LSVQIPDISVVVPIHNESGNLKPLIEGIANNLQNCCYEIIYVNDGSTDNSRNELQQLLTKFPSLRVFHHDHACGQSRAIITGIRQAKAPLIITLDGDGQNDPADIPNLISAFSQSNDPALAMIIGHRKNRKDTSWRRFSSKFALWVRATVLNDNIPDTGCGIKIFKRCAFLNLPTFTHMHRYLPVLFRNEGYSVSSLAVNHLDRTHGISNYGTLDRLFAGIYDVLGVLWLTRRTHLPKIEVEDPNSKASLTAGNKKDIS
jgi:dolichol-phosphate mannosyltransferase